jgi:hypothetical protein
LIFTVKGSKAKNLALLIWVASLRWCLEQRPVRSLPTILPLSVMYVLKASLSLYPGKDFLAQKGHALATGLSVFLLVDFLTIFFIFIKN